MACQFLPRAPLGSGAGLQLKDHTRALGLQCPLLEASWATFAGTYCPFSSFFSSRGRVCVRLYHAFSNLISSSVSMYVRRCCVSLSRAPPHPLACEHSCLCSLTSADAASCLLSFLLKFFLSSRTPRSGQSHPTLLLRQLPQSILGDVFVLQSTCPPPQSSPGKLLDSLGLS